MRDDRTVHAITVDGHRVVRYDRAGKWYVEDENGCRQHVTLDEAVRMSTRRGSAVFLSKQGGREFDRRVTRTILERAGAA